MPLRTINLTLPLVFMLSFLSATAMGGNKPFLVKDINLGTNSSSPAWLTNVNGSLFFSALEEAHGVELWKHDTCGTELVANITPGEGSSSLSSLTNVNGTLFFRTGDGVNGQELWKHDTSGTEMVIDINPGAKDGFPNELTNVNGTLFFSADDGTNGRELWKHNACSTEMVMDINPTGSSLPIEFTHVNGTLFFSADDGVNGRELWKHDASGTAMVSDIYPGAGSSSPSLITNVNGTLFFSADDGMHGRELWKHNACVTEMVSDISPGPDSSFPSVLTTVNCTLYFNADDGTNGRELWKHNATGTEMVSDINPTGGSIPSEFTNVNGALFFSADDGTNGRELWKHSVNGTKIVSDINLGAGSSFPEELTNEDGTLVFRADDGINGVELWKHDASGTEIASDIHPGVGSSAPRFLTNVNGTLFFSASDGTNGRELWAVKGNIDSNSDAYAGDGWKTKYKRYKHPDKHANTRTLDLEGCPVTRKHTHHRGYAQQYQRDKRLDQHASTLGQNGCSIIRNHPHHRENAPKNKCAIPINAGLDILFDNGSFSGPQVVRNNSCGSFDADGCDGRFTIYDDFVLDSNSVVTGIDWHQTEQNPENYLFTELRIFNGVPSDNTLLHTVHVMAVRVLTPILPPFDPPFESIPAGSFEALASVSELNIPLPAGTYWLGIHNEWQNSGASQWSQTIGTSQIIQGRAQGQLPFCGIGVLGPSGECLQFHPNENSAFKIFGVAVVKVNIDIKPGRDPNCLNINDHGVVPVAILGNEGFDVFNVDQYSLSFSGLEVRARGEPGPLCRVVDSNTDGFLDLVCHFEDNFSKWDPGDGEARLTGTLLDGTKFEGSDSICIAP